MQQENIDHLLKMINSMLDNKGESKAVLTTHSGKFTHPDSKVTAVIAQNSRQNDGFLRTGNVNTREDMDAVGNGAYNNTLLNGYKVLREKLGDHQSILEHLETESEEIRELFAPLGIEFNQIKQRLYVILAEEPPQTDARIRQVYFPINDDGDYHLLSIVHSAPIMDEMKARIRLYSEESKQVKSKKRKNLYDQRGCVSLRNLTQISFGGRKPQNITAINSKNGGNFYLLPTIPPMVTENKVRLPKKDFFRESIWLQDFTIQFHELHKILALTDNNYTIRNSRDEIIHIIIENIICTSWQIRFQAKANWSQEEKYSKLPQYQKIWLDEHYSGEREDEWLEKVTEEIARWFINAYEKILKKRALEFGDDEMNYVEGLAEHIIKQMIRENNELLR